jgi:Metallo-beta-lactamase superfamily
VWSPISSTLIYGKRDAVLVDVFITVEQADALTDWVKASGKNLTTIYATHGHGDHFFSASTVLQRFPRARLVATPDVAKIMREQASWQTLASFWNPHFPGEIADHLVIADELTGNVIDLEGAQVGRRAGWPLRRSDGRWAPPLLRQALHSVPGSGSRRSPRMRTPAGRDDLPARVMAGFPSESAELVLEFIGEATELPFELAPQHIDHILSFRHRLSPFGRALLPSRIWCRFVVPVGPRK